jgi:hypothetical protein
MARPPPPAPGSPCSTRPCAPIRPLPARCAPASHFRAPRLPQKSCASTRTKPRCATSASPLATCPGQRRTSCRSGAIAPAGRPASTQPGFSTRLDLAVDPNGLAASLKACAGEGDPVSAAAKAGRPINLRVPGRPSGPLRNLFALGVRHHPCHSARLAAASTADRHENPGSDPAAARCPTADAKRSSVAKRLRGRDRAGRRLRPRPRRFTCPAARTPCSPSRPNSDRSQHRESSTYYLPKIASRQPKRPATRR